MFPAKNLKRNLIKFFQQPGYGIRVLGKRLKAVFFYRLKPDFAPLPEALTLFLTHNCNLRCKMCGQWGDAGVTKNKSIKESTMDFEKVKKIIDNVANFKPNITLFGGEPLLHKNIIDIVSYIKIKKMHCLMITNAYLLEEYADDLIETGIDEINISIDGPRNVHDSIRGIEGLFDKISAGIKKITYGRDGPKPLINLQTTITKFNYDKLPDMLEVAKDLGADSITFHNLIYLTHKDIKKTKKEYPFLKPEDWEGFVMEPEIDPGKLIDSLSEINAMKKKYDFMINVYPNFNKEEIRKYYTEKEWFPESYKGKCQSPWICSYIFPDGSLHPCLNFGYSLGNVIEEDFKEVWNGKKARKFRELLKKEGRFSVCRRCTEIFRY
ncbi:MAG: radical SAM protein [Elusimicrobia bacterium]|jgi:radical SAM protein with 4Fe4S-binding SPASM domain|nr:radical SAM protein [Elusimicrobiota bacterium]